MTKAYNELVLHEIGSFEGPYSYLCYQQPWCFLRWPRNSLYRETLTYHTSLSMITLVRLKAGGC